LVGDNVSDSPPQCQRRPAPVPGRRAARRDGVGARLARHRVGDRRPVA